MATKRRHASLGISSPWKRPKSDDNFVTEHELKGRTGSKWHRVGIPSCSPYRGSVFEIGRSFSQLLLEVIRGNVTSYPEDYVQFLREDKLGGNLVESVQLLMNNRGFAFYSANTALSLNLPDVVSVPRGVVCDVILLTFDYLPVVLVVVDGTHDIDQVTAYRNSLTCELTYAMRDYTDEGFNMFDSIVDIKEISKDFLKKVLKDVCLDVHQNFPTDRLCMSRGRCLSLARAILAQGLSCSVSPSFETQVISSVETWGEHQPDSASAEASGTVLSFNKDSVHLMSPEQFRLLNLCINTKSTWLVSSLPGTGKIRFALETARRLSLAGPTLILCECDEFRRRISYYSNIRVVTRPELQARPTICIDYENFVVVKAEQIEFQSGRELIFDWHHYLDRTIQTKAGRLVIVYDKRDDPDIDSEDVLALDSRRVQLQQCLIPDDIVLELLSKKVLSIADLIWIKKRNTREGQNEELINSLRRTSRRGYDIFLRALQKTKQEHLAELLETNEDASKILMSKEHLTLLKSAEDTLIHKMIPFGVLSCLCTDGVFTTMDVNRIQAEGSLDLINEMLLQYLYGKSDKVFFNLLQALQDTHQEQLSEFITSGTFEGQATRIDSAPLTLKTKFALLEKMNLEELLLELEVYDHLYTDDLEYIQGGNNVRAFPDGVPSPEVQHSTSGEVFDRLLELLGRKFDNPSEILKECLQRTGQFEALQVLLDLPGASAEAKMETSDQGATYRILDVKFIETKAFQAVLDRLRDPNEMFIVLTGAPGEGKTTAALQAMRLHEANTRKLVIKTPDEFNLQVSLDKPTTVVLDDVFGIVDLNESAVRQWVPILQKLKNHVRNKPSSYIKIIITSRNYVWRAAESIDEFKGIIPMSSVIDFTVLVPLVRAEKKRMLDSHLEKYGIALDPLEVDRIAETDGTLGFPLCCKLFAAEPMFQDNPMDFFSNPLSYIVKVLISSCEDPSNLMLIKQVVMSKGQLDRRKIEFGVIDDKSVVKMKNYVFEEGNILYFPHKSIADAASYVMATQFSIDFLGECSLQFLYERVREKPARGKSSDADIQIHVNQKDLQSLIHRLGMEISKGHLALACSHPALMARKSVIKLLQNMTGGLELHDKKHGGSFLYWSTWNNTEHLCKEALERHKFPDSDLCEAVLGCCLSGNKHALIELLKRTDLARVRLSGIKYLPKISTRQQLVTMESVRMIEISGGRMAHLACQYGHMEIMKVLLDHGLDVNARDENGETCLMTASGGDNPPVVSFLLGNNAQWSSDNYGHNPLHHAVEREKVDVLELLLQHSEAKDFLNRTDKDGESPLHLACLKKSLEMVNLLLIQGADVDVTDSCGWTPLHYVSWIGHKKMLDILVKYNADVNAACKENSGVPRSPQKLKAGKGPTETEGMTALHLACHQGHLGMVKKLTDLPNININAIDVFGKSALYIASKRGYFQLVSLLLGKNADTSLATSDSRTAVYAASKKGHNEVIKALCLSGVDLNTGTNSQRKRNPLYAASRKGYVGAVDCLASCGANVNFTDSEGNTSLHIACAAGHTDVVKCLLKWGADVLARNSSEQTPLHDAVAASHFNADIIDYLLLAGADVNTVDSRGWTPLHLASLCSSGPIVKTLLLWKADVQTTDAAEMTALRYASAMGRVDNISVLLKHDAAVDAVCVNLAVIYGHAEATDILLRTYCPISVLINVYTLAKEKGNEKVVNVIKKYLP